MMNGYAGLLKHTNFHGSNKKRVASTIASQDKKPEQPANLETTSWTLGNPGTNNAVLVFRADILKTRAVESPTNASTLTLQNVNDRKKDENEVLPSKCKRAQNKLRNVQKSLKYATEVSKTKENDSNTSIVHETSMPAFQLKLSYKLQQTETKLLRHILNRHGLKEVKNETNFSLLWTGIYLDPDTLSNFKPYQRVNHFPRSLELTRKDNLYKNIVRMQRLHGMKHFDIVPQSFTYPKERHELVVAHSKYRGPWIVKPTASSRGRGIYIVSDPEQIFSDEDVIVSKYVANPFCINGHKCDLRIYVLVTSYDPLLIYIYEEGLVRLATEKYELKPDNLWNPCIHLCNYSVNKFHSDYVQSNDEEDENVGHKWTLSAFLRHLKKKKCNTVKLMSNIEDLIIKVILSCAELIVTGCRRFMPSANNCFELYGFDLIIDESFKPWLIEVNMSPSVAIGSRLDSRVKACLITDLLTCVGIPAVDPKTRADFDKNWTKCKHISAIKRPTSAGPGKSSRNVGTLRLTEAHPQTNLTAEEGRVIRNARLQNARRGGFVRIFPTHDTMRQYGNFLDKKTGLCSVTPLTPINSNYQTNYNHLLFKNLYGEDSCDGGAKEENSLDERMIQYERSLPAEISVLFNKKPVQPKDVEKAKRLRAEVMKMICSQRCLTISQSRKVFSDYLYTVARRMYKEPSQIHEKLVLKFLNHAGGVFKPAVIFRSPPNLRNLSRARTAIVLKLLGEFLELYDRDTEIYLDTFRETSLMPTALFREFLSQAFEVDLERVLSLQTKVTGKMSFFYARSGPSVPPTPTIPLEEDGFLKALPAMVRGGNGGN